MAVRLVRYLAQCGVASRRKAGDIVEQGLVAVNGEPTDNPALQVGDGDTVTVRGETVRPPQGTLVLVLNKPKGLICSRGDPHNPRTVYEALPLDLRRRVKAVGRLDMNTTGLLLFTDDGELAHRLTHPSFGVEKTYQATVRGKVMAPTLQALRDGVELDDGPTAPAEVRLIKHLPRSNQSVIEITIHEGRNRQVRRMCEAVDHRAVLLERTAYGPLNLDENLKPGDVRPLTEEEESALRAAVGE